MLALLLYLIGAGRLLALLLLAMAIAVLQRKPHGVGENRPAVVGPAPRDSLDRSSELSR